MCVNVNRRRFIIFMWRWRYWQIFKYSKIDVITSQFGLQQLIPEPTHNLTDSSPCIDLVLTFQPNLAMESGVHSSLYQICHHQLLRANINLKVFYPSPYEREIWHYPRVNVDLTQRAIEQFSGENWNWNGLFI